MTKRRVKAKDIFLVGRKADMFHVALARVLALQTTTLQLRTRIAPSGLNNGKARLEFQMSWMMTENTKMDKEDH